MTLTPDQQLADHMAAFFDDPLGFVMFSYEWDTDKEIQICKLIEPWASRFDCEYGPDKWACEFLDELGAKIKENDFDGQVPVDAVRMARASGHGIGKSAMVGWLVNFIMSTRPNSQGTITANTSTQLNTKTWPQIVKWTKKCITAHWFRLTSGQGSMMMAQVDSPKTWFCSAQTCKKENSEAFAGQHAPTATSFYIFDEGSAVEDIIYEVAEGGLTDGEPMEFVFGNPTKNSGRFYDIFKKLIHRWSAKQIDSRDAQITNKKFINELIEDHGIDSDFVKVRVRGMFPAMSAKQFISVDDVDKAYGKHLRPDQYNFAPKILTCDPAWMGDDLLTIGLRQGLAFKILRTLPKNDNDVQVANILANLEDEHEADAVFIDGGYGTGIYSAGKVLKRTWRLVWSAEKSPDAGCLNMRAYMIKQVRDWLKEGGAIPEEQRLYDDLITPEAIPRLDGKIQIESKKDMRARGMPSTDYLDILGLSFAYPVASRRNLQSRARALRRGIDQGEEIDPFDSL
jgi:hypothetical protein